MNAIKVSRVVDGRNAAEKLAAMEALENAADLRAALKARKEKGKIPWEQVKAELGLEKLCGPASRVADRKDAYR